MLKLFRRSFSVNPSIVLNSVSRESEIEHKNRLFDEEFKRQKHLVGRLQKIEVNLHYFKQNQLLLMNKDVSTPYDCVRRKFLFGYTF